LAELVQSFASSLDIDETINNAIERFIEYMSAEAASIFLLNDDSSELECRGCAGPVDIRGLRLPSSAGIVGKTVLECKSQMVRDVKETPDFNSSVDRDTGFETRSILCAPLMIQGRCIGALELINKKDGDGLFDQRDENILVSLASAAALAINNARMADKLINQERIQKELELAREIQLSLLPTTDEIILPIHGVNLPAREVSGDFYDYFEREDGLIYFNLADVSGKGMNAALLMAKVSSLLRLLAREYSDPGELIRRVNDEVCETVSHGMFVTLVSGFIDPKTDTIRFTNAGHPPALFHEKNGEITEFSATAPPIGIESGMDYPVSSLSLAGGKLYIYSDGVIESVDDKHNELGVEGLIRLIQATDGGSENILESLINSIRKQKNEQHDDITMLLIECSNK
jgi:sigma-B regulation protein RsbU (phosphoserine phosphatase)